MNKSQFDSFLDDVFIRAGDPDSTGMAQEINGSWSDCFDREDDEEIGNLELITRMKDVLHELRRELDRYESALDHAYEDRESEE